MSSAVSFAYLRDGIYGHTKQPRRAAGAWRGALVVAHKQDVVGLHSVARVERQCVLAEGAQALQDGQIGAELAGVGCGPGVPERQVTRHTRADTSADGERSGAYSLETLMRPLTR
jgi:hypothetical protein